jgi:hypothetical protein
MKQSKYTVWWFVKLLNKLGVGDEDGITIKPFPKGVKVVEEYGSKMTVTGIYAQRQMSSTMGKFNFSLDHEETTVFTRGQQWIPDVHFARTEDMIRIIFESRL